MAKAKLPTNLGMFGPAKGTTDVFDNKKATHKEVAFFVSNSLRAAIEPVAKNGKVVETALSALFLYLAEVGVCGVKITQKEISEHYTKRLKEEQEEQEKQQAAAKEAAEKQNQVPPCPTSEPSPVS